MITSIIGLTSATSKPTALTTKLMCHLSVKSFAINSTTCYDSSKDVALSLRRNCLRQTVTVSRLGIVESSISVYREHNVALYALEPIRRALGLPVDASIAYFNQVFWFPCHFWTSALGVQLTLPGHDSSATAIQFDQLPIRLFSS